MVRQDFSGYSKKLDEITSMTKLEGLVINDTIIIFIGKDTELSDTNLVILVTLQNNKAFISGKILPPACCDSFYINLDAVAAKKYSGGTGEPNDPFQISTSEELIDLGDTPEDYNNNFILTQDINLSGYIFNKAIIAPDTYSDNWNSTHQGPVFNGFFDGNDNTIVNMTIKGESFLGLFGNLGEDAAISNLGLENSDVNGTGLYISSLAGCNNGNINNCYSTGIITGNWSTCGLVGINNGNIISSFSSCQIEGPIRASGFVSENNGNIISSYSNGSVNGNSRVGGFVSINKGLINKSFCNGTITGSNSVGGLVSWNFLGSIVTCYSTGTVTGGGATGGLVGENAGPINTSYSTGMVTGTTQTGGLVGENAGFITSCFSSSDVNAIGSVGGLIGTNFSGVTMCYCNGTVKGNERTGGLIGDGNDARVISCFWDNDTSGQITSVGGTGLSTIQMKDPNNFLTDGWDCVNEVLNGTCDYWQITSDDYPILHYTNENPPLMPEGSGTIQQPYLIRYARDIGTVWYEPLAHYRLENSLNLSKIQWSMAVIPIFCGTFDGNGHTINNLNLKGSENLGLFGRTGSNAEIANLGLNFVEVNGVGNYIGGLIGENRGNIYTSYVIGTVIGNENVGGLVGINLGNIIYDYALAAVSGNSNIGGLVGRNGDWDYKGTITHCYSTGHITGEQRMGGLVGVCYENQGIYLSNFWDIETSGQIESAGGTGLTTTEMQIENTFINTGWDFIDETTNGIEDIWWIDEYLDYPRLWWE
jgi:hypothetical protein